MSTIYKSRNPILRFLYLMRLKICLSTIRKKNAKWILELGTGSGILLPALSKRGEEIIGLDVVHGMGAIKNLISEEGLLNCHLIRADSEFLPFRSNIFDLIVAASVLDHLSTPENGLAEVYRTLKPKFEFVLSTETRGPWQKILFPIVARGSISNRLKRWFRIMLKTENIEESIGHNLNWDKVKSMVEKYFEVEHIEKAVKILPLRWCGYIALRAHRN